MKKYRNIVLIIIIFLSLTLTSCSNMHMSSSVGMSMNFGSNGPHVTPYMNVGMSSGGRYY